MSNHNYYVYITTNPGKSVLYSGITNNIIRRKVEHFTNRGNNKNFAERYYCYNLVYYEYFTDIKQAIFREKEIKNISRIKKELLISRSNPKWNFIILD